MRESLERLIARINANAHLLPPDPTGNTAMPSKVKLKKGAEFQFKASTSTGGGATKYDWDAWFNGDLLLLERSSGPENDKGTIEAPTEERDYGVPTDAMGPKIKTAARRRYKVCQISRMDADGNKLKNALIIKARDMDADERQAEDLLRAEEKEAMKTKKAAKKNGEVDATATDSPQADAPAA